jgi:hypothetical protein
MLILIPNHREELAAMALELQSNRAVLDEMTNGYSVFVFTGGCVPTAHWNLVAMTSYLEHLSTTDGLLKPGIERYRDLAQAIGNLGQTGAGPRTLRCRRDMGNRFDQAAAEIRLVTDSLASTMTSALERLQPVPPAPSTN